MMTMLKTMLLLLLLLLQLTIHHTSSEAPPHRHHRRHLPSADSDGPHKFSVEQRKALQQVIRTMMGFGKDEVPPPPSAGLLRMTEGGGSSGGAHPSSLSSSGGGQVAPRYMHRLYEKYRIAETEGGTKGMADTVRNMNAELVICNNGTLFAFNLTSIAESESVLRAEIHIYKRRPRVSSHSNESSTAELPQPSSPEPPGFIVIKVYELGPGVLRERSSFRLPDAGHSGWTIFDVTSAVKDCASTLRSGNTTHMLALGFSLDDDDTDGRSRSRSSTGKLLTLSKFVRKLSKPFLMVFSQENRSNYLDAQLDVLSQRGGGDRPSDKPGIDEESWRWVYDNPILLHHDRSLASRRKNRLLPPTFRSRVMWSSPSVVRGPRRQNLSDEIFAMESPSSGPDLLWNTSGRVFQKFAVEEEAIGGLFRRRFYHAGFEPDHPPHPPPNNVPAARDLRDRRRKRQVVADNEIPQDVAFPDPDPVPFVYYNLPKTNPGILRGRPEQQPGKKKKKKDHHQSTPRPKDIAFGSAAHEEQEEGPRQRRRGTKGRLLSAVVPGRHRGRGGGRRRNGAREDELEEVCGKRKLVVDFADIGWREWIISPRSFEAHYCDGLCSYPMAPRLRPTNHATIQSIVKAIGLQTDVPSPCCIPASLSSVTLLYFDQNQNVVLKNYPDMTVRSCACR